MRFGINRWVFVHKFVLKMLKKIIAGHDCPESLDSLGREGAAL